MRVEGAKAAAKLELSLETVEVIQNRAKKPK